MHMYGFGFPGQGFYCLKLPGVAKKQEAENMGLISVEKGEATEARIEEELKYLIDKNWQWKVKKVADQSYLAVFPNKQILTTLSKSNGVSLALYKISAKISITTMEATASATLQTGWVQLSNIPDRARTVEAVTLIAELAGDVVAVDEVSIIKEEPVRVKMQAREVANLRGYIQIFIDGIGYDIRFVPEGRQSSAGNFPPPRKPDDDLTDGDDEDLLDSENETPRKRKSGNREISRTEQRGGSTPSNTQAKEQGTYKHELVPYLGDGCKPPADPLPLAVYDPTTNKITKLMNENSEQQKISQTPIPADKLVAHLERGDKLMDKDKGPNLGGGSACMGEGGRKDSEVSPWELMISQESIELEAAMDMGEFEEEPQVSTKEGVTEINSLRDLEKLKGWESVKGTKQKTTKRKFYPVVAARKSSRVREADKEGTTSSTCAGTSSSFSNNFSILNTCNDDDLEQLANDCDISLGADMAEIQETLSAMKIEEAARAALAEANYRYHMEQSLQNSHALEGENLMLQVIDNGDRGFANKDETITEGELLERQADSKDTKGGQHGRKQKTRGDKGSRLSRELKRISIQ
ncbi:unnamed protein product [Urochloa humidicola]